MQEWAANPRSGTSFDMIMDCGSNSNSSSKSHLSTSRLPPTTDKEVPYTEYKFLKNIDQQENHEPAEDSFSLWVKKKSVERKASTPPFTTVNTCAQMQQAYVPIFNSIVTNNCPSMCSNAKWVWVALITLSTGSTVSICLWIVYTRRCTMKLTKIDGNDLPMLQFQESSKKDAGASHQNAAGSYNSTGPATPTTKEDGNGGSRRRSKPKTVNININP